VKLEHAALCERLRDKKRVRNYLGLSGPALAQEKIDSEAVAAIESLSAELDSARKDAERYRWLRGDGGFTIEHWAVYEKDCEGGQQLRSGASLDSAIDAAIAREQGER
jgi:hypothetical protein